jgi:hypothetical protein
VIDRQLIVDRRGLRDLLAERPEWKLQDFANAIGRSLWWVKKSAKRLGLAGLDDHDVLVGHSCARHTPAPPLSQLRENAFSTVVSILPTISIVSLAAKPSCISLSKKPPPDCKASAYRARRARSGASCTSINRLSSCSSERIRAWNAESQSRVGNSTLRMHRAFQLTQMANSSRSLRCLMPSMSAPRT